MWVRTQDKEILMKVDNINLGINVDTKGPNRLFTFVDGVTTSFTLGKYKSKERAIEVLDEIQKLLIAMPKTEIPFNYIVYQMPEV